MRMYDIIAKKKHGEKLTDEEFDFFINGYINDEIPEYQVSALLMAIYFQGLSREETVALTHKVMHSGDVIDLSDIEGIKVDKHSSGGVGDTTTLVLAPLVSSCGVPVAKMSGRGLGHTGGTLDKLEAIEGFNIHLKIDEFVNQVNKNKVSVIGQTKNIAPADKKLYALRDVTATVDNIGLIAASIMSKKLAAGSDKIVLDVKVGSGAFVKELDGAIELAQEMVNIGTDMGRETVAIITSMEQPLGYAIGNANEVREAIDVLKGQGPDDLRDLCVKFASTMVHLGGGADSFEAAKEMVLENLSNGKALEKMVEFVTAQGGNKENILNPDTLPTSDIVREIKADKTGYIKAIQSDDIGIAAMILGAGRETMDDVLDMGAGIYFNKKIGDYVEAGEVLGTLMTNKAEKIDEAIQMTLDALEYSETEVAKSQLIKAKVTCDGVEKY
ncbi:pyrimidine-nucleoside phosphorylase [Acidaminobacter sp. JC074]|uniref:pyrimidine-nucleoside phosphorylase n=1 Tax=Acidaminobacter sp. JC074 TaxID=2530199 RepID=UPI001F0ED56F|nr:pyrimidine-nucleoside phosphorylase [Acidaminobacter sp. JC074]MCH4888835.1 pyrimidine-nucleoside phosphorylase [Acidaminobacter sp. JC074]